MKLQKKTYELLETGTYAATVDRVEEVEGKYGQQLRFVLALEDSDVTLSAWCSATYSDKSKLSRWVKAILGELPDELDTEALVGKPCRVTVVIRAKEDGTQFNRVDEILPPRKGQKPKPEEAAIPDVREQPIPF